MQKNAKRNKKKQKEKKKRKKEEKKLVIYKNVVVRIFCTNTTHLYLL